MQRGGLDAVLGPAEVDGVEVPFHNGILVIGLLELLRPEDLFDLSLDGDGVIARDVLDELLGDRRAAEGGAGAKEHIGAGLDGGDPVHALMLIEALVLDGDGGMHQILGNFLDICPTAVGIGIDLLIKPDLALRVHIMDERGLIQAEILLIKGDAWDDVLLQIVARGAHQHEAAHNTHQKHCGHTAQRNLQQRERRHPRRTKHADQQRKIPLLTFHFLTFFHCHIGYPPKLK